MFGKSLLVAGAVVLAMAVPASGDWGDADGGDTEFEAIDMGSIIVHSWSLGLEIWYWHTPLGWTGLQVGIAFDTIPGEGGTWDPWNRRIDFVEPFLPDFVAYKDIDSGYDDLVTWDAQSGTWIYDQHDLFWWNNGDPSTNNFVGFYYGDLGIDCSQDTWVFMEIWITQDNCNKGPLDLGFNDDLQLSTPGGTIWELPCDGSEDVQISSSYSLFISAQASATESNTWSAVKRLWR